MFLNCVQREFVCYNFLFQTCVFPLGYKMEKRVNTVGYSVFRCYGFFLEFLLIIVLAYNMFCQSKSRIRLFTRKDTYGF